MKRSEVRALADDAYRILDNSRGEAAEMRALQVMVNAPDDPESFLLMAEVAEEQNHFDQALMFINSGLTHFATHVGLLLKKASLLMDGFEDIDEAFIILTKLHQRFSDQALTTLKEDVGTQVLLDIYLLLTDCHRLRLEFNHALVYARHARDIAPLDDNAILALATAHFELGDYDDAITLLTTGNHDAPDFNWQRALVLCAQGRFVDADEAFALAYKLDKTHYHRPVRLDEHQFANAFVHAVMTLPREIRGLVNTASVTLDQIVPREMVKASNGGLSPQICMSVERVGNATDAAPIIHLYQKNIENLATRKIEIKDLIASALIHDLAALLVGH